MPVFGQGENSHCEQFENGLPVVQPLKTFEAVKHWTPDQDKFCRGTIPLRSRQKREGQQLLVCHDFKGGYQDDRYIQGCSDADAYRFFHWHLIDEFIYFSHYFVSIPPPGWTNAAHLHGVSIYGTIITEWDEGKARCEEFLSTKETYEAFVDQLVSIAEYYRFDGWLINIENVIKNELIANLLGFVQTLTDKMHEKLSHSKVIWYDSVISTGELKWQNEINDLNSQYFAACDGLFVNYTWKDKQLENSTKIGTELGRLHDLYFGIDVYGRGCRGNGGFNTKEALEAVHQHGLSAAVFAFGWVYEKLGPANFTFNEVKFWSLLQSWCQTHPYYELPVSVHFCHGNGHQLKSCGETILNKKWSAINLQSMQPQPQSPKVEDDAQMVTVGDLNVNWNYDDAFSGGSCLKLTGKCGNDAKYFRLCKLSIDLTSDDLFAGLVVKPSDNIHVILELAKTVEEGKMKNSKTLLLDGKDESSFQTLDELEIAKVLHGFESILDHSSWSVRVFRINVKSATKLEELGLQIVSQSDKITDFEVDVGQVFLFTKKNLEVPLVSGLEFVPSSTQENDSLSGLLSWTCPESTVLHYKIFQGKPESDTWNFIGHCHATRFQVDIKDIDSGQVRFKVQPFVNVGFPVNLKICPTVHVDVHQNDL